MDSTKDKPSSFFEKWKPSALHTLCFLVFLGQVQNYMMRGNLSILIVAMVNNATANDTATQSNSGTLDWTEWERGMALSAFGYGYLITQIIGGRLAELIGIKIVYGLSLFLTGICTFLSPLVAKTSLTAFCLLRGLIGICEGATFPTIFVIGARWVPASEQNRFMARGLFGHCFGLTVTYPLCGYLTHYFGWESAFYFIGCLTTLWFIAWWLLVFDSPDKHPRISQAEQAKLMLEIRSKGEDSKRTIPWRGMLTSLPVLGVFIADFANNWGWSVFFSNGPTYLRYMLDVDIRSNGLLSALPMLMRYIGGLVHSQLADYLLKKQFLSTLNSRRIFTTIALGMPGLLLAFTAFYGTTLTAFVTLNMLILFFNGSLSSGYTGSYVDIAPNFVGTLFGISNTVNGSTTSFLVPLFIGALTNNNMTFIAWKTIFLSASAIYVVGNVGYVLLVKAERQPWDRPHQSDPEKETFQDAITMNEDLKN